MTGAIAASLRLDESADSMAAAPAIRKLASTSPVAGLIVVKRDAAARLRGRAAAARGERVLLGFKVRLTWARNGRDAELTGDQDVSKSHHADPTKRRSIAERVWSPQHCASGKTELGEHPQSCSGDGSP